MVMIMNRILKHKSIIAFFLVFTLSFGVISNVKQEEPQAIAIVDDIILWILGGLVLGTGVVALSNAQQKHTGGLVYDGFLKKGYSEEELFVKGLDGYIKGVKITNKLKEVVSDVSAKIFNNEVAIESNGDLVSGSYTKSVSMPLNSSVPDSDWLNGTVLYTLVPSGSDYFTGHVFYEVAGKSSKLTVMSNVDKFEFVSFYNTRRKVYQVNCKFYVNGIYQDYFLTIAESSTPTFLDLLITSSNDFLLNDGTLYSNPKIRENYQEGLLEQSLPYTNDKAGYWEIPLDNPFDQTVNEELPLDWDRVKDQITDFPTDVPIAPPINPPIEIPDNPAIDIPDNPAIDKPVIGDSVGGISSLWDLIKGMLQGIFDMLKAILDFLLGLIGMLLTGLLSLIKALFIPTIAVSELFSPPAGSGFGMLVDLFNFDKLWSIEPKPFRFKQFWNFNWLDNEFSEEVEIRPFEVSIVEDNINIIRNVLSYSILIAVIWFVILHFLPERSMD